MHFSDGVSAREDDILSAWRVQFTLSEKLSNSERVEMGDLYTFSDSLRATELGQSQLADLVAALKSTSLLDKARHERAFSFHACINLSRFAGTESALNNYQGQSVVEAVLFVVCCISFHGLILRIWPLQKKRQSRGSQVAGL